MEIAHRLNRLMRLNKEITHNLAKVNDNWNYLNNEYYYDDDYYYYDLSIEAKTVSGLGLKESQLKAINEDVYALVDVDKPQLMVYQKLYQGVYGSEVPPMTIISAAKRNWGRVEKLLALMKDKKSIQKYLPQALKYAQYIIYHLFPGLFTGKGSSDAKAKTFVFNDFHGFFFGLFTRLLKQIHAINKPEYNLFYDDYVSQMIGATAFIFEEWVSLHYLDNSAMIHKIESALNEFTAEKNYILHLPHNSEWDAEFMQGGGGKLYPDNRCMYWVKVAGKDTKTRLLFGNVNGKSDVDTKWAKATYKTTVQQTT